MATALLVRDETATGTTTHSFSLDVESTRMTVRELIVRRVEAEVAEYNKQRLDEEQLPPQSYNGLVRPEPSVIANATMGRPSKPVDFSNPEPIRFRVLDVAKQYARALEGFESNSFFILIGDYQPTSLDEVIEVEDQTEVAFVRLIPLVGG